MTHLSLQPLPVRTPKGTDSVAALGGGGREEGGQVGREPSWFEVSCCQSSPPWGTGTQYPLDDAHQSLSLPCC